MYFFPPSQLGGGKEEQKKQGRKFYDNVLVHRLSCNRNPIWKINNNNKYIQGQNFAMKIVHKISMVNKALVIS